MTSVIHASVAGERYVVGGVDAHADSHTVAVLDTLGRRIDSAAFPTTTTGYRDLHRWLTQHGQPPRSEWSPRAATPRR